MIYGSVCSGIEAATAAWHPLGWRPSFFSEIESFPRAVLTHHYPEVPLHGDFTTIRLGQYQAIDLLVGGTPCQSFSIAGLRGGLDDDRGNLALEYLRLADRLKPRWLVWENVPGVLSSNGGRDFGAILGGMVELGYGVSYRVLDAQFFGLAQRRKRVFVVGYLGDWRRAAAVLFERHSLSGGPAPGRETGPPVAALTANGVGTCGADDNQAQAGHLISSSGPISHFLNAGGMGRQDYETETLVARWPADVADCLDTGFGSRHGQNNQHINNGASWFVPASPSVYSIMPQNSGKDYKARQVDVSQPVLAAGPTNGNQGGDFVLSFGAKNSSHQGDGVSETVVPTLDKSKTAAVMRGSAVRRLTPVECERLQGFPDNFTAIPWRGKPADQCPDGPRYKALGNSFAVPVVRWIGRRIEMVEGLA